MFCLYVYDARSSEARLTTAHETSILLWETSNNLFISSLDKLKHPRPRNLPHQRASVDLDNSYAMEFIAGLKDTGIAAVAGPSKQFSHAT